MSSDLTEMVVYVAIMVVLGIISMVKQRAEKARAAERAARYGQSQADEGREARAEGDSARAERARRRKEEYEAWRQKREARQADPAPARPEPAPAREEQASRSLSDLADVFGEVARQAAAAEQATPRSVSTAAPAAPREPDEGESFWRESVRSDYDQRGDELEEHLTLTKGEFHASHEATLAQMRSAVVAAPAHVLHRSGEARTGLLPSRIAARLTPMQQAVVHSFILERPQRGRRR